MKKRDIAVLVTSVAVFIVLIALIYRYFLPPTKNSGVMVTVPHPVKPTFNQDQLHVLKNDVKDYSQDIAPKDNGGTKPIIQ